MFQYYIDQVLPKTLTLPNKNERKSMTQLETERTDDVWVNPYDINEEETVKLNDQYLNNFKDSYD